MMAHENTRHPSLIVNDDMQIDFSWSLWGAEVDLVAKAITGAKRKITDDMVTDYLAGILDGLVLYGVENKDKRELAKLALIKEGKSTDYVKRYLQGWDSVDGIMHSMQEDTENGTGN